jgi:hypothetical protein
MNFKLFLTLISLSVAAIVIGVLISALLFWLAPNNPLFQVLADVREFFVPTKKKRKRRTPPKKAVAHVSEAPSKTDEEFLSSVPHEQMAARITNEPIAANSDTPQKAGSDADLSMAEHRLSPPELSPQMDKVEAERNLEFEKQAGDDVVLDNSKDAPSEEEMLEMSGSDLQDQIENSDVAAESFEAHLDAGSRRTQEFENDDRKAVLPHLDARNDAQSDSSGDGTSNVAARDTLVSHSPERSDRQHVSPWKNEGDWEGQGDGAKKEGSHVQIANGDEGPQAADGQELASFNPVSDKIVNSEPPMASSETWSGYASPQVSKTEILVSERSTVGIGSWDAGSASADELQNETVRSDARRIIDDREEVRGSSGRQVFTTDSDTSIVNNPRIESDWRLGSDRQDTGKAHELGRHEFSSGIKEREIRVDNSDSLMQADVGFRGQPIKAREFTIENDDDPSAEQLRLEALKNKDLRGVLMSLNSAQDGSNQSATTVTDLSRERGAGHARMTGFYPDGSPKTETDSLNGIPHGAFLAWYDSGNRMIEGHYQHGNAIGMWTLWDSQGSEIICADISKVLNHWDYKAKVRYIPTSKPATEAS